MLILGLKRIGASDSYRCDGSWEAFVGGFRVRARFFAHLGRIKVQLDLNATDPVSSVDGVRIRACVGFVPCQSRSPYPFRRMARIGLKLQLVNTTVEVQWIRSGSRLYISYLFLLRRKTMLCNRYS